MVETNFLKSMDKICVLDFGGQYAHLISRRIRELGVYVEIYYPDEVSLDKLKQFKGIILSGGPQSVYEENSPKVDPLIFELQIPVFGICYGHQLMAYLLKGDVKPGITKEYGFANINFDKESVLFSKFDNNQVWMSHGDSVKIVPNNFKITASTSDCEVTAMENSDKNFFGVQFHPEVVHTKSGMKLFEKFIEICDCQKSWSIDKYQEKIIDEIKQKVGNKKVFMLLSGGVDSTVCFALLHKALPKEKIYGLHIDNGFMRYNESEKVKQYFEQLGYDNFHIIDASNEFIESVKEIYEPEEKRKIIGNKFIEIQKSELKKIGLNENEWMLGQGTIYPDTIESKGTKNADLIKTHHNRVDVILEMIKQGMVIEPLEYLYKDEVRNLGHNLGLPKNLIERHPFPGPGLSIRCLCTKKESLPENINDVKQQIKEIIGDEFDFRILPIKSVGVQGDSRSYKHSVLIDDNNKSILNKEKLTKISTELTNKIKEINRVLYNIATQQNSKTALQNSKFPHGRQNLYENKIDNSKDMETDYMYPNKLTDFKTKKCYLTNDRLDNLRLIDNEINNLINKTGEYDSIWQFPVVLIPVGNNYKESIVLRPIVSTEAMTAEFTLLKKETIKELIEKIKKYEIDYIMYDITNKPPGTIEWE